MAFEVVFHDRWFEEDVARASVRGKALAVQSRAEFEANGVSVDRLRACEPEGPDGTHLPRCVKTYLGPSVDGAPGRWGMVFAFARRNDQTVLRYLAFGIRHQPTRGRAPTVYYLADQRLPAA